LGGHPRVLEPQREVVGATPRGDDVGPVGRAGQPLEVDVPEPGDVAAVGDQVVDRDEVVVGRPQLVGGAQHDVEARGVLGEEQAQLAVVQPQPLHAAEAGPEAGDGGGHGRGGHAEGGGGGVGGDQVVGVVDAADRGVEDGAVVELEAL